MRGSDKLKAILALNNDTKSVLIKSLILYNAIALFMYWNRQKSFILYAILSPLELIATFFIFKICCPKIDKENGVDKLVSVVSINSGGAISFCWDVLFWAMLGKILITFGKGWALVYIGIPCTFFFEFLYKPYKKLKTE